MPPDEDATAGKDENLPLQDEAQAREKWRGGDNPDVPEDEAREADDGRPGDGSPGTIPPPD